MSTEAPMARPRGGGLSDEEVVERVLRGETALFEIVMRRYNDRLYRAARAIVGDDEAEDVMQDAYVRAYTHLDQFAGRARFSTWLTRIAVHEALARARRAGRFVELDEDTMGATSRSPEQRVGERELGRTLEAAVDGLPAAYRAAFMLRDVEGMSTAEAAECLDIPAETVKTRLHRARALVRASVESRVGAIATEAFRFHLSRCDRVVATVLARIAELAARAPSVR